MVRGRFVVWIIEDGEKGRDLRGIWEIVVIGFGDGLVAGDEREERLRMTLLFLVL